MSEWKECKIADAPFEIIDGDRGTNYPKQDEFNQNGYCLFLNAKNVTTNGFAFNECYFISKEKDKILRKGKLQRNDIILTTRGTVGNIGFFNERIPYDNIRINSGMVIIRSDPNGILPGYTHQLFKYLKGDFDVFATGSAQPQLPIRDLKEISFILPPLLEQHAIAGVLSSLDDKIDLLHRQNKTLEGMAEALWRKMFVEEAAPGWKKGKLGDYITVKGGTTPSTKNPEFWNGNICWTSPRDLSGSNKVFLHETERRITEKGLTQIGSGLLPVGTVLLSSRAPIGYLTISNIPVAINQGYIAVICDRLFSNSYMFLWIKSNMDLIIGSANGSTFLEISKSVFKSLEANVPNESDLEKFDLTTKPVFGKILANEIQIRTLSRTRDTLLPKLMSGEVRVRL
jgi:type I restriction enzyme S subunit